jgi:hypothetical protein
MTGTARGLVMSSEPKAQRARPHSATDRPDYSVSIDLPENLPITEIELRALEILLGDDLKRLLEGSANSLKYRSD